MQSKISKLFFNQCGFYKNTYINVRYRLLNLNVRLFFLINRASKNNIYNTNYRGYLIITLPNFISVAKYMINLYFITSIFCNMTFNESRNNVKLG